MKVTSDVEATFFLTFDERLTLLWALRSPGALATLILVLSLCIMWIVQTTSLLSGTVVAMAVCFGVVLKVHQAQRLDREKHAPHTYRFDESGAHVTSSTAKATLSWRTFSRVRVRHGILFLYVGKGSAHCVPLRAFGNSRAVDTVMRLAASGGVPQVGS